MKNTLETEHLLTVPGDFLQAGEDGPNVLFLHGLFGDPDNWRVSLDRLAPSYRAWALKFPFFSESDLNNVRALTDYTLRFLDQSGIERLSLCGNSLGGQVALDLYLRDPGRVEALVLTGSSGLWETQPNGNLPKATREFVREQARRIFYDPSFVDDELVELVYAKVLDRSFARMLLRLAKDAQRYTLVDQLKHIAAPTLLVWGREDQITPPSVAELFHRELPSSELVFFDRCGHAPPLEHPDRFAGEVRRFLDGALKGRL